MKSQPAADTKWNRIKRRCRRWDEKYAKSISVFAGTLKQKIKIFGRWLSFKAHTENKLKRCTLWSLNVWTWKCSMICASTLTLRFVFSVFDVDYTHLILWLLAVSTYVFIAPTIFIYLRSTAAAAAFFLLT